MLPYEVSGGSASAADRASDEPDETPSVDELRVKTNHSLLLLTKMRKHDLEKICKKGVIASTGLKSSLLSRLKDYLKQHIRDVEREGTSANIQGQQLVAVMGEIFERYKELVATRPNMAVTKEELASLAAGLACMSPRGDGSNTLASRWNFEAKAEVLRRSQLDPFVEVANTLAGPAKVEKNSGAQARVTMNFHLTDLQLQAVRSSLSQPQSTPEGRKTRVLMRSYKLNEEDTAGSSTGGSSSAGSNSKGSSKGGLGAHLWPLESVCNVNGITQILKQRKVFYQSTTRKLKGDCSPQDIGEACSPGNNRVEIATSDGDVYAVIIQIVRLVGVEEVFNNVKRRPQLTKEEALRRVKRSFLGQDLNDFDDEKEEPSAGGGGMDSDDELIATATRLSLRCPVGLVPLTCPGRGRFCQHLQCFDLPTFLNFNKDCAGAGWKCIICNVHLQPADLVVDTYLADVVESLKEQGLTDEVDEIEIDVDGTWKPLREDQKAGNSRRDRKKMPPPPPPTASGAVVSQTARGEAVNDSSGTAAADAGGGGSATGGGPSTLSRLGQAVVATPGGSSAGSSNDGGVMVGASGGGVPANRTSSVFASPSPSASASASVSAPTPSPAPAAEPFVFDLSNDSDEDDQPTESAVSAATGTAAVTRAGAEVGGRGWGGSPAAQQSNVFISGSSGVLVVGGGSSSGSISSSNSNANAPAASRGQPLVQPARFRETSGQTSRVPLEVPPSPMVPQPQSQRSGSVSWGGDDSAGRSAGGGSGNSLANGNSTSSSIFLRDASSSTQMQTNVAVTGRSRSVDPGHGGGSSRDRAGVGGGRDVGWGPPGAGGRGRGAQRRDLGTASTARQREHTSAPPSWEPPSLISYNPGQAHKSSVGRGGGTGPGGVSLGGGSSRYSSEMARRSYSSDTSRRDGSRDGNSSSSGSSTQRHERRTPPPPPSSSSSSSYNTGGSRSTVFGGGRGGYRPSSSSQSHGRGNNIGGGGTMKDVSDAWASLTRSSGGAATAPPVVGWDSVGPGGGVASSMKRPRPSSGHSPDYQRRDGRGGGRANRDEGGGGGGSTSTGNGSSSSNGVSTMPFMGDFEVFSSRNRAGGSGGDNSERGDRGRLANGGRYWDEPSRSAGRRGGVGSVGVGGLNDAGSGGSVVGWNDEVLRNLDGLGDPIG